MRSFLRRLYSPVVSRVRVPADRSEVFDVVSDPGTYPAWLVGAEKMRDVDDDFPRPGSTFEHSVGAGPITIDDESESMAVEPDSKLVLRVHAGPFHAIVELDLTDGPDHGTDVCLSERPVGWFALLTPLLRPTLHARNSASLAKLRDLVVAAEP